MDKHRFHFYLEQSLGLGFLYFKHADILSHTFDSFTTILSAHCKTLYSHYTLSNVQGWGQCFSSCISWCVCIYIMISCQDSNSAERTASRNRATVYGNHAGFTSNQTILFTTGVFLFMLVSVYIPPQASVCEALQHLADRITWSINTQTHFSLFSMFFNRANLSLNYQITQRTLS